MANRQAEVESLLEEGFRVQNIVPQTDSNRKRSFQFVKAAADLDSTEAMTWCAEAYQTGFGIKLNLRKARNLAVKAAKRGNARAKYLLADIIVKDRRSQDFQMAYGLALEALSGGEVDAEFMVAWMLYRGCGVEADEESAIVTIQGLADAGQQPALRFLERVNSTK